MAFSLQASAHGM